MRVRSKALTSAVVDKQDCGHSCLCVDQNRGEGSSMKIVDNDAEGDSDAGARSTDSAEPFAQDI